MTERQENQKQVQQYFFASKIFVKCRRNHSLNLTMTLYLPFGDIFTFPAERNAMVESCVLFSLRLEKELVSHDSCKVSYCLIILVGLGRFQSYVNE